MRYTMTRHAPLINGPCALRTVVVRAGANWASAVPGGPGSLPVGVGGEVVGIKVDGSGSRISDQVNQ